VPLAVANAHWIRAQNQKSKSKDQENRWTKSFFFFFLAWFWVWTWYFSYFYTLFLFFGMFLSLTSILKLVINNWIIFKIKLLYHFLKELYNRKKKLCFFTFGNECKRYGVIMKFTHHIMFKSFSYVLVSKVPFYLS
jgi:hypothetical protein